MIGLIETLLHPDHFWIENIAVAPDYQGKGWGRRLLAHAEGKACLAGRGELRLLTNEAFANNVALYEAVGFSIDRTEPFMGGTTVSLSKRISCSLDCIKCRSRDRVVGQDFTSHVSVPFHPGVSLGRPSTNGLKLHHIRDEPDRRMITSVRSLLVTGTDGLYLQHMLLALAGSPSHGLAGTEPQ